MVGTSALLAANADAQPRWGRPSVPRSGACFYSDIEFRGEYFCASVGEDIPLLSREMNNRISSIRVFGDAAVSIFQGERFSSYATRIEGDARNLRFGGWNDSISSIRVAYDRNGRGNGNGRDNDRGRGGYGSGAGNGRDDRRGDDRRAEMDASIRRAYQDVLKRDADNAGLVEYRGRMVNDHWTEKDVRDALLKSEEYRIKFSMTPQKAQDVVARAYRAVLNREPDGGSVGYVNRVLREGWTQADVERELRNSAEYRSKHR